MELRIPFRARGHDGVVTVEYEVNENPQRWGNPLLGFGDPPDIGKGFPVCRATVAYDGEGYASVMGWIQILRFHGTENGEIIDLPPQLAESEMPYVYWGPYPSFFDNPFTNKKGVHWTADAFLVVSPDAVMTRVVQPVCGFHWGYSTEGDETSALPLTLVDPDAWVFARMLLRERYRQWEFRAEWANEMTA